jgi:recombination protein RecT
VTLRNLFEQQRPELAKLLPRGMDPDRLFRMALTECIKNPKLLECTAESWALAMQTCAQQGLYPDSGLGFMYLVPRKKKDEMAVSAMRGYQGDIRLARNTGEISDIYAEVVYAKDKYKVVKGLNRDIVHEPYDGEDDPGPLRAVYAVAKLHSGEVAFVTLTKRDVERHRASSESAGSDYSPWLKHEAAMWKKTAIHELAKWLPKATEIMERAVREITGDQPIDITPMKDASVAYEAPTGLAGLAAKLKADLPPEPVPPKEVEPQDPAPEEATTPSPERQPGEDDETPVANCKHPSLKVPSGKTIVCPDCTLEVRGPHPPQPSQSRIVR